MNVQQKVGDAGGGDHNCVKHGIEQTSSSYPWPVIVTFGGDLHLVPCPEVLTSLDLGVSWEW